MQTWVLFRQTLPRRRFYVYQYESYSRDIEPTMKVTSLLSSVLCPYIARTKVKISGTSNLNDNVIKIFLTHDQHNRLSRQII